MTELLPCPFCNELPHRKHGSDGSEWIVCLTDLCANSGNYVAFDEVWNTRVTPKGDA